MAKIEPEFTKRNAKLIGLSADPVDRHASWAKDIHETQGSEVKYPMIGDHDLKVAKLYNMLPADEVGADGRTAANNATVRSVFIIGPDKKIKLMLTYPMTTGRNFDEILRVLDSIAADRETPGRHAGELEARRRRDHRAIGVRRRREEEISGRVQDRQAVPAHGQATGLRPDAGATVVRCTCRRRRPG